MKLTVETQKLQDIVAKAAKGASDNKMIPVTGLMAIVGEDDFLTLITTDATNYLYITEQVKGANDFYAVVQVELFSKLISKITDKDITLEVFDDVLYVKGNGVYKIELPLDEEGKPITYPKPNSSINLSEEDANVKHYTIDIADIRKVINVAKSALSTTIENPCYMGYYIGDNVIATDTYKICGIDIKLFDEPVLMSAELMDLIDLCSSDFVNVYIKDLDIVIDTNNISIVGKLMDNISDYAVDAITSLLDSKFESFCTVNKGSLVQLLDRLSLFVGVYDKNEVTLTFSATALTLTSKQINSTESISYLSSVNPKPFKCAINILMLQSQVKANSGEVIEIGYGLDNAIKLSDDNVTQILALQE